MRRRHADPLLHPAVPAGHLPGNVGFRFKQEPFGKLLERSGKATLQRLGFRSRKLSDWQRKKNYAMFQRFLPGNEYDTRVTVIGNRAFAFSAGTARTTSGPREAGSSYTIRRRSTRSS